MFPLTRVPFWVHFFDPEPYEFVVLFQGQKQMDVTVFPV